MKVTDTKGENSPMSIHADYITQTSHEQYELLMSIIDARFTLHFDAGVGYIATSDFNFPQGIEFNFNQNPDTGKYVGYLVDHDNEVFLDFAVADLEPTRANVNLAIGKAYDYLENR